MPTITRTWIAFAAIGTGLIHVALVIGSPVGLGVALAVLGLTEFGWGVLTFARDSVPFPRAALVVALAPALAWALLVAVASASENVELAASLPLLPLAVATLFELVIVAVIGVHLRRPDAPANPPGVARYLISLLVGALAVAALTTPALAATQAGLYAVPHGEHSDLFDIPGHGAH